MNVFDPPLGWAYKFSPLALRIYEGCDVNCVFCGLLRNVGTRVPGDVQPIPGFRKRLPRELARRSITRQVLVGYPGDPYCHAETRLYGHARFALDVLHEYQVPVAILTRMGTAALRDLGRFATMHCKVGAVLACDNPKDSREWEPDAALPADRIAMLRRLKDAGVHTWACLEPVGDTAQTLALIDRTHTFVDEYRISMPLQIDHRIPIDKQRFAGDVVDRLRGYGKPFYITESLQEYVPGLRTCEIDPDHLTLAMETADCA